MKKSDFFYFKKITIFSNPADIKNRHYFPTMNFGELLEKDFLVTRRMPFPLPIPTASKH